MKLVLRRFSFTEHGIFGTLFTETGDVLAQTLEHAYSSGAIYQPKLPVGEYTCVRGMHRLAHMITHFETFEITNVPGHSDILFHTGNINEDSAGCVLLGSETMGAVLVRSREAFAKFMAVMNTTPPIDAFTLTVKGGA